MKTVRTLNLLGLSIFLTVAASMANAGTIDNGLGFNGLGFNGLGFNGLGFNGFSTNGLGFNGLGFNGSKMTVPFEVQQLASQPLL